MEGCPKRESKESLPLRGLIRQCIFIRSLWILFVQILGMLVLSTIDDRFKMIRVLFASNLCCEFIFHVVISCSIEIAFCKIN